MTLAHLDVINTEVRRALFNLEDRVAQIPDVADGDGVLPRIGERCAVKNCFLRSAARPSVRCVIRVRGLDAPLCPCLCAATSHAVTSKGDKSQRSRNVVHHGDAEIICEIPQPLRTAARHSERA